MQSKYKKKNVFKFILKNSMHKVYVMIKMQMKKKIKRFEKKNWSM